MEYSVIEKPIVTVTRYGKERDVTLRELICHAHEYENMGGNTLERYALLRFVAALVMDMLPMKTADDRRKAFEAGRFNVMIFDEYVTKCRMEGEVFDLFNTARPFMQSVFAEEKRKSTEKPAAILDLTNPPGNGATFMGTNGGVLNYSVAENVSMSIPKAFRAMLARQCFCGYSLEGPWGINGLPLYLFPNGANLFETIMLNTLSEEEAMPLKYGRGLVPWRNGRYVSGEKGKVETDAALLEAMTWQPRKIQWLPTKDERIRQVYLTKGLKYDGDYTDPFVIRVRNTKKNIETPLKPDIKRSGWITIADVIADMKEEAIIRPPFMKTLMNVYSRERPKNISVTVVGLDRDTQLSKYYGWVSEEMALPESLLENSEQAETLLKDLRLITTGERTIALWVRGCVDDPAAYEKREKKGKWSFTRGKKPLAAEEAARYFVKGCKDVVEDMCLSDIGAGVTDEEHTDRVCEAIKGIINDTISYIYGMVGLSTTDMVRVRIAEKKIRQWMGYQMKVRKGEAENGEPDGALESEQTDKD